VRIVSATLSAVIGAVSFFVTTIGFADLPPPVEEELRENELDEEFNLGLRIFWLPGVSIAGGFGQASVPYAPPFKSSYDLEFRYNTLRISALSLDLRSLILDDVNLAAGFSNYFPAAGREFDAQVLSMLNIDTELALRKKIVISPQLHIQAVVAGFVKYERVSYPKGNFAVTGYPVQIRFDTTRQFDSFATPQAVRLEASSELLQGARTAVKFNYAGTNVSSSGQRLVFVAQQPASGVLHRAALTYAFVQRPGMYSSAGSDFQHHISLHWSQKQRNLTGFLAELAPDGTVSSERDVEMSSTEWGITWSERF
jgi:hypothetical protein